MNLCRPKIGLVTHTEIFIEKASNIFESPNGTILVVFQTLTSYTQIIKVIRNYFVDSTKLSTANLYESKPKPEILPLHLAAISEL